MGTNRQRILERAAESGRQARRAALRRQADRYVRNAMQLRHWTFPPSRPAIEAALAAPHDAAATRALCRTLYRDWRTARALPRYLTGRHLRIDALRELLACECILYRRQSASVAAQKGMDSFLAGLARMR